MITGQSQSIGEVFLEQLVCRPDAMALLAPCDHLRCFTWRRLAQLVGDVLAEFEQRSIAAGAHVASWLPNGLAWIATDLACQLRGAVHVALDARLPLATALSLADHAEAQLLVVADARMVELESRDHRWNKIVVPAGALIGVEPRTTDPRADRPHSQNATLVSERDRLLRYANLPTRSDAPAQMLYTSGTMSQPKGVLLSHGNLLSNALAKLAAAPQYVDDVRLNVLPFAHAYARTCELSTWIISGSLMCIARDWSDLLTLAPRIRPTLVNLVPHLAQKLVTALESCCDRDGQDPRAPGRRLLGDRLRLLQVGGAALPATAWDRLAEQGWPPLQGYGLTEASPVICSNRAGDQRSDSVGASVPGVELRLDEHGVLWTRGPHVMLGYWKAPFETAAKVKDGWLCTGDLAEAISDGRWRIIGRADDQITLSTGYKASPAELVRRLSLDPWVEQLVILGQDRPYLAALVYPRWSQLPDELFDGAASEPSNAATREPANAATITLYSVKHDETKLEQKSVAEDQHGRPGRCLSQSRFGRALVQRWSSALDDLPRQLRIERIGVLHEPLASENGGLNFKGGVRRKFVEQVLMARQVAELYDAEVPGTS